MDFNFENLNVYKKSNEFVHQVYSLTKAYPKAEMFGLTSQLRRAAVSISLNIGVPRLRFSLSSYLKGGDHGNTL